MLSCHTWPQWRGPSVDGVTYLVREIPIGATEYAFGRTKIFVRTAKTVREGGEIKIVLHPGLILPLLTLGFRTYMLDSLNDVSKSLRKGHA